MLGSVQRLRAVSNQPFLDRGTVRRGVWFIFLEFAAFEREKMRLHIFRAESGAVSSSAAEKGLESARAAGGARRVRGFKCTGYPQLFVGIIRNIISRLFILIVN